MAFGIADPAIRPVLDGRWDEAISATEDMARFTSQVGEGEQERITLRYYPGLRADAVAQYQTHASCSPDGLGDITTPAGRARGRWGGMAEG